MNLPARSFEFTDWICILSKLDNALDNHLAFNRDPTVTSRRRLDRILNAYKYLFTTKKQREGDSNRPLPVFAVNQPDTSTDPRHTLAIGHKWKFMAGP